jgi:hypothetical protein
LATTTQEVTKRKKDIWDFLRIHQYWLSRKKDIDASPALVTFFEGPEGLAFLHRLITAAHFEFTKVGVASIHNVNNFLKSCGLAPFVACSYTTHQRVAKKMDKELINSNSRSDDNIIK